MVAWVVLREGASADAAELADHVAGELAPHKRPRTVNFLDELPRNELGKVVKAPACLDLGVDELLAQRELLELPRRRARDL